MLSRSVKNIQKTSIISYTSSFKCSYGTAAKQATSIQDDLMNKSVLTILKENQKLSNSYRLSQDTKLGPNENLESRLNVFLLYKLLKNSRKNDSELSKKFPTLKELELEKFEDLYMPQNVTLTEQEQLIEENIYNVLKLVYDIPVSEKNDAVKMGPHVNTEYGVGYGIQKQPYGTSLKVTDPDLKYFLSPSDADAGLKHGSGIYEKLLYGLNHKEKTLSDAELERILEKISSTDNIFETTSGAKTDSTLQKTNKLAKSIKKLNYNTKFLSSLGCSPQNVFDMQKNIYSPKNYSDVTVEDLLVSQCHLGESAVLKHPYNDHFIYDIYKPNGEDCKNNEGNISIIDLNKTLQSLKRACQFLTDVVSKGAYVLVIGNKKGLEELTMEMASKMNGSAVTKKWPEGALTNINSFKLLRRAKTSDSRVYKFVDSANNIVDFEKLSKSQKATLKANEKLPDAIILLNPVDGKNKCALNEAKKLNIPVIGLCDTDTNHNFFDYSIPCNDDSLRSITFIGGVLARAGHTGLVKRQNEKVF